MHYFSTFLKVGPFYFQSRPSEKKGPTVEAITRPFCQRVCSGTPFILVPPKSHADNTFIFFHSFRRQLVALEQAAEVIDLYPYNGGYSVMGVDSDSAVGLLGLLLFIDLLRVKIFNKIGRK